jgi:hypothetical protein
MIALPSPLGFGFLAFGTFEPLFEKYWKPKSLRTMIKRIIGSDLASRCKAGPDSGPLAGVPILLFWFHTHVTLQATLTVIPKAPFNLGGIFQ